MRGDTEFNELSVTGVDELNLHSVYMLGIGGIGMSALARYFLSEGKHVAGYDRTATPITQSLSKEGADIHFSESVDWIREKYTDRERLLVIYTPAIPDDHPELIFFRENNFKLFKRAEVLGMITREKQCLAVAGTHGKTTVSTMITHLFVTAGMSSSAILGGISKNYQTNAIIEKGSEWVITEADEYDRSFLQLNPATAVITSCDADHMDIYGSEPELKKAFGQFISRIEPGGTLLIKYGLEKEFKRRADLQCLTYSIDDSRADFYGKNIRLEESSYHFSVSIPGGFSFDLRNGYPGKINVENAVAVAAVGYLNDIPEDIIRRALETFTGVKRRFDIQVDKQDVVYIDDYAHHPKELEAFIQSVRDIYPDRSITGIFQPHLYSRTKDLAEGFASSLSNLDELILLDIYPAREKPIEGVTSGLIYEKVSGINKVMSNRDEIMKLLKERSPEVLLTMGAGDIDQLVEPIRLWINTR